MIITFFIILLCWILLVGFAYEYGQVRGMPHLELPKETNGEQPFVSILIPVRNEERNIARLLDGALQQHYKSYEIIVVDDDSTDDTPNILHRYARHKQFRNLKGTPLPLGWMGKNHACQQAATAAKGEWLLFLDADTVPLPSLVASLITHAQRHNLDMLSIFPFMELKSFWERVILPPFFALLYTIYPFAKLNDPTTDPNQIMANGQCILVRRRAYETIKGHHAVYAEVLDDVMIARAMRRAGFRTGAALGLHNLRVRMYTNGREIVQGLSKNAVAGFNSGGYASTIGAIRQFAHALLPMCLLAYSITLIAIGSSIFTWLVLVHAIMVCLVAYSFWAGLLRHLYKLPLWYALLWPSGLICYGIITLHSVWKIRSGRGIQWKGRNYAGI